MQALLLLLLQATQPLPSSGALEPEQPPARPVSTTISFDHYHQFGLTLAPGLGFRSIFPYQNDQFCGDRKPDGRNERVCTGRLPWYLELEASFGLTGALDVILATRFGIEGDFNQSHFFFFSPGIKYYFDADRPFKIFSTLQAVFDKEDQSQPSINNFDFAFRNANGIQYDLMRRFGLYAQIGETLGFIRWLRFELDFTFGVQGRLP